MQRACDDAAIKLGGQDHHPHDLYEEMRLIASPERGVARFWTYPPTPSRLEAQEVNATMESYREMTVPETQQGDAV